jgi:hypothetical protein
VCIAARYDKLAVNFLGFSKGPLVPDRAYEVAKRDPGRIQ